ncbi:hypothetical protein [Priestia megaterium]|uniref:hypothetical protein n=1 Tax=Priestia megaterium TaxID=1404 RepID=UPI003241FB5F
MSEQIDVTQELAKLQQRVEHLEERMEKAESKQSPLRSLWEAIRSIFYWTIHCRTCSGNHSWRFSGTSGKMKKVET